MFVAALVSLVLLVVGLELFARFVLGLGDPPLLMPDERIEYLARPSRSYKRFGNRIAYNRWSMRCDDFPQRKTTPDELRILVMGDSVVNGGARVDQSQVCTALLQRALHQRTRRPVVIANISCGSWGPPNLLAYVERFGLFDADIAIIVLSSHDAADVPTFAPFGADAPVRRPALALQEVAQRIGPRIVNVLGRASRAAAEPDEPNPAHVAWSLAALRDLIGRCRAAGTGVIVCQHRERGELDNPHSGFHAIAQVAGELKVPRMDFGPAFARAIQAGQQPYLDHIHPSATGHGIMADEMMQAILQQGETGIRGAPRGAAPR